MRLTRIVSILMGAAALAGAGTAQAQVFDFTTSDWLTHRAGNTRTGGNGDPGIAPQQLRRIYVWPPTADMPAEMISDNSTLPPPAPAPPNSFFEVNGAWIYPAFGDRAAGAWPYTAPDIQPDKLGDYVWAEPVTNTALSNIGIDTLSQLPNLGTDPDAATTYASINQELNDTVPYARWTFGTVYPVGTAQGTRIISDGVNPPAPLAPNQRYAIFIRFPNSGTLDGGTVRPNTDHVMVRVSWGANVNDPVTSRIFMVNFGETGGYWKRIRTGPGDDRYFPYDGTNPLRVTVYTQTPDPEQQTDQQRSIVVADAVRLVPEAMRGDIHASAASARFPANVLPASRTIQRTYFGRDETTGPIYVNDINAAGNYPPNGYTAIAFDPTRPAQTNSAQPNYNPIIGDPTSSLRSAVFYCIEDDFGTNRYGRLAWRYVARRTPVPTTTIDDLAPPPNFQASNVGLPGGWTQHNDPADLPYATTYLSVPVTSVGETAVWQTPLASSTLGESYSVFVWIPGGDPALRPAHYARYTITTAQGPVVVELDQRNQQDMAVARVGMWRRLASGIRFGPGIFNGMTVTQLARVTLNSDSARDVAEDNTRVVLADAVQFVPESQSSNSVVAAPTIANVTWPSGQVRQVVYFATTDGHVWALDALGGGANSTLTTAYWVYPSISNPDPAGDLNNNGAFDGPQEDPNLRPDTFNNQASRGIDGDLEQVTVNGQQIWVATNRTPDLGPFTSSPVFVRRVTGTAPNLTIEEILLVANMNGRVYAFDPAGRADPGTGNPFAATQAAVDNPGIPGTTRRWLTWPTVARDKWLRAGAGQPFGTYTDDPSKGFFAASIAAPPIDPADPLQDVDHVIAGAGDGHVYSIELDRLDFDTRISNSFPNAATQDGQPRWMYPDSKTQLPPILHAGALMRDTFDGQATHYRYVFSAGGRVYAVKDRTDAQFNELPGQLAWVYPFTGTPPGNPDKANDIIPEPTDFTAPAVRNGLGINGGNFVAFVANRDGRVFAIDANANMGTAPAVIWQSRSQGPTRSSTTFLSSLQSQGGFTAGAAPAIFLPSDTGGIVAFDALQGRLMWSYYDAAIGGVPMPDVTSTIDPVSGLLTPVTPVPTSFAWRGADAIMSNSFVYNGDEGNQDTGEMNGQFRAYGSETIGLVTPGEPDIQPGINTSVELRLVDLWNARRDDPTNMADPTLIWEDFNSADPAVQKSPYNERIANHQKPNTQGNFVVYEWGDTIYAAAWGFYTGTRLPQVTMTLSSGTSTRTNQALVRRDLTYNGPPHFINDGMGTDQPANAFIAVTSWPLGRGSDQDPQTPGRNYTVAAQAQAISVGGFSGPSNRLFAGQFDPPAAGQPPAVLPQDPNNLQPARTIVIAHPFALTTRGVPGGTGVGAAVLNSIGWTTNYPVNGSTGDLTEIVQNGNVLTRFDVGTGNLIPADLRDLVAPVGMVPHGSSASYQAIDAGGRQVPALFVADRSNLYKMGQTLNNVRVARSDLSWGWDPTNGNAINQATGNVMNPLPWETFPNTVPNVSLDYPNVDRARAGMRSDGIDMATRPVTLTPPVVQAGIKTLRPTPVDLVVSMPKYQPANVNRDYFGIDGTRNPGMPQGLLSPLSIATGAGPYGTAFQGLMAPSAGYYGTMVVYIGSGTNTSYQGSQAQRFSQVRPAITGGREDVFRQLTVAAAVPPDINLRSEEETVDIGNVPHGMGYSPTAPFAPAYSFMTGGIPYNSPWDQANGSRQFFLPFTVKNQGNVNLWNVRVARVIGDYATSINDPTYWVRMLSDQVDPITAAPIWSRSFNLLGNPAVGNIGVISTLDHLFAGGSQPETVNDTAAATRFWPYSVPNLITDYVQAPNILGWPANSRLRPTIHKPLPDTSPQTMSVPDVAFGDRFNVLNQLKQFDAAQMGSNPNYPQFVRDTRPKISVAVPLTTPAGTYTTTITPFEDHTPIQWREWLSFYRGVAVNTAGDDDGKLNIALASTPANANLQPEGRSEPGFKLKVTVRESRITNGQTPGSFGQLDVRAPNAPAFGANVGPVALRDPATHKVILYFASNRLDNYQPLPPAPNSDLPWFLHYSTLNSVDGNVAPYGPVFDWRYEAGLTRWWDPLPPVSQYPSPTVSNQVFPAQASDVAAGNPPLVPGALIPETVRHASPATAIAEPLSGGGAQPIWLFWQGVAYKGASTGAGNRLDTRTFYVQLENGLPPNGLPNSFLNDPALPKYGPKPLIITDLSGNRLYFLFWYGGAQGRTRLYFNANAPAAGAPPLPDGWSPDTALNAPASLQWQADPQPIHRIVYDPVTNQSVDAIDVVYTGVLSSRRLAETMLTRFQVVRNGNRISLRPMPLTLVDSETLSREGNTNTWNSRDLAWVTRDPVTRDRTYTDPNGRTMPLFQVYVYDRNNTPRFTFPDNTPVPVNGYTRDANGNWQWNQPDFEDSTQRWIFRSALGGTMIVDTQNGSVTFNGVTPRATDRVSLYYVPQTLRVNVTRNESGAVAPPAGWANDAGFQPKPHVPAAGSNTGPVAFMDRSRTTRAENVLPTGTSMPVTRLWTFYRKTNSNVTATATIYYKTMRLMVRLPRGVLRDFQNGSYSFSSNISITGNRGPVEVDWVRGRLYFTELDEGNLVNVTFNYARDGNGNKLTVPETRYRVGWGDEISTAVTPGDQPTNEVALPTDAAVNEGQVSAFKDPFQEKVWVFWASTRFGTTDIYYLTLDPPFYALPVQ